MESALGAGPYWQLYLTPGEHFHCKCGNLKVLVVICRCNRNVVDKLTIRAGAEKIYLCEKGHIYGSHFLVQFTPLIIKKCGFVPEIPKLVPPLVYLSISAYLYMLSPQSKYLYLCFHGQRFQFWCLKVRIINYNMKDAP